MPLFQDHLTPAVLRLVVPNDVSLLGATLYQQVLSVESSSFGPPFTSMALSAAGRCVFGL